MDSLQNFRRAKGIQKAAITRLEQRFNPVHPATTIGELDQLKEKTEKIENKVQDLLDTLIVLVASPDETEELQNELLDLDERIQNLRAGIFEALRAFTSVEDAAIDRKPELIQQAAQPRLPVIELPSFHGRIQEWISFRESFSSLIHANAHLGAVEKLQYLQSCLKGPAAAIIRGVPTTHEGYATAWELLEQRYEHPRETVFTIFDELFHQPHVTLSSASDLRRFIDVVRASLGGLRMLRQPVDDWDAILIWQLRKILDAESLGEWELSLRTKEVPLMADFLRFLEQRAMALAAVTKDKPKAPAKQKTKFEMSSHTVRAEPAQVSNSCLVCHGHHLVFKCPEFLAASVMQRKALVIKHKLCFNCLASSHQARSCAASGCKKCGSKHNSLLHQESGSPKPPPNIVSSTVYGVGEGESRKRKVTVLPTAMVSIADNRGVFRRCRALIDTGSEASFVSAECLRRLRLHYQRRTVPVRGIGAVTFGATLGEVDLHVQGRGKDRVSSLRVHALVINKIADNIPAISLPKHVVKYPRGYKLADHRFNQAGRIDILLGADVLERIFTGKKQDFTNQPTLYGSIFGWIAMGLANQDLRTPRSSLMCHQGCCDLDSTLRRWWEVEELPIHTEWTAAELNCENQFQESCGRSGQNRFIVRLPFNDMDKRFVSSRDIAIRRLQQVERKLEASAELRGQYNQFMKEYETLGHMVRVQTTELEKDSSECCYLPHHAIHGPSEETSGKFRVVFDASAKYRNGVSLNDTLLVGPKLQKNLFNLIVRFRLYPIALSADIEKMYRQILVHEKDAEFQRIVWREAPEESIQDYRLLTVTYGTASAPYLATRCLVQLAKEEESEFPQACRVLRSDFYMDDLLSGARTISEAQNLTRQLSELLSRGGFRLRKWCSNKESVLQDIPVGDRQMARECRIDENDTVKTLGISWNVRRDVFVFRMQLLTFTPCSTKRQLLSQMAKMFDPLGWLSPFTIRMKRLMQDLWQMKVSWDTELPEGVCRSWSTCCEELKTLEQLEIPRHIGVTRSSRHRLLAFSDASEKAYAGCVYLQAKGENGTWQTSLLAAKTRIAPLKRLSLPRLELCAALLVTRLYQTVLTEMDASPIGIIAFTDSRIVLDWLSGPAERWKVFVANRVSSIVEVLPREKWRHVKGSENPADLATRGITTRELICSKLWWHGPSWVQEGECPLSLPDEECCEEAKLEERKVAAKEPAEGIAVHMASLENPYEVWQRFSSWLMLQAVIAYCERFIHNARTVPQNRRGGTLTAKELCEARIRIAKAAQADAFRDELDCLRAKRQIPVARPTARLSIFLDENGIIRVGGRLREAHGISETRRHPALLPKRHHLTELLVDYYHKSHLHAGPQLLQTVLQNQYWIIGIRDVVRGHVRRCIMCVRNRATVAKQMMGDLPVDRVNPARPFSICGVDFAGPFNMRVVKFPRGRKTYKGYFALFVCFATRAIHLEAVSELSTQAFLAAFKRFVSRRGLCHTVYSDCATNFVGANKELKIFIQLLKSSEFNDAMSRELARQEITWYFNPPAAPHMGGLWEAGIKSVKYHLRRIIGETILNFEEFTTVLAQIEACLNSRPLTPASIDPTDLTAITPGHFLVGGPITAVPEPDYTHVKTNLLTRWQLVQNITQHFWKRWSTEMLSRLQQRPKWVAPHANITCGDLVLIKDKALPPTKWNLGRIQAIYPGKDGLVRVAEVRTTYGLLKRPIHKLAKLPLDIGEPSQTGG